MAYAHNMGDNNIYRVDIGYPSGTTLVPPFVYVIADDEADASQKVSATTTGWIQSFYGWGPGGEGDPNATNGEYVAAVTLVAAPSGNPAYAASVPVVP